MRKLIVLASLALGLGFLAACGPGANGEGVAVANATRESMLQAPMSTVMSCSGWAAFFEVDLAAAQELVPGAYELVITKSALDQVADVAHLTLTAITCETFTWNGVNYPTSMLLVVIDIVGPPDGEPVAGTAYGFLVLEQVTSPAFHAVVAGHGERAKLVKSIDLGGPTANNRQGSIVEANGSLVSWREPDVTIAGPIPLTANAVQYWQVGKSANAARVVGDTQCVEYVNGVGAIGGLMHPFILTVGADSQMGKLGLGTTLVGAAFDADLVTCTGHISRVAKDK